jgi:hypothetical protein
MRWIACAASVLLLTLSACVHDPSSVSAWASQDAGSDTSGAAAPTSCGPARRRVVRDGRKESRGPCPTHSGPREGTAGTAARRQRSWRRQHCKRGALVKALQEENSPGVAARIS